MMKQLKYRSVDSLLKRQDYCSLYFLSDFLESSTWQKDHTKLINKLDSTAFELKPINFIFLSFSDQGKVNNSQLISYKDEIGSAAIFDNNSTTDQKLLSIVITLIDMIASFKPVNISVHAARLSTVLAWWEDMDGLIADLNSQPVPLSIKDAAANSLHLNNFSSRVLDQSRLSFWRELLTRYENHLDDQEQMLFNLKNPLVKNHLPAAQPVFEYVEDIDG